uniref:Putative homing endonuclease n=1 Tax=viral metagenome TaxID=1070528 RepID=A0A6M3ISG4_9ZZZZ
MKRVEKVIIICWFCKKDFKVHPYRQSTARFCNFSCHGKYRVAQRPDRFFRDKHGENHPMWGKKLTLEWRRKISLNHANVSGINSPTWKGGLTPINEKIRKSLEYEEWRKVVFERDNYTCQHCGEIGGYLQADHIKPFALFSKLRLDISNGQTLCKKCHVIKTSQDMILMRRESILWR